MRQDRGFRHRVRVQHRVVVVVHHHLVLLDLERVVIGNAVIRVNVVVVAIVVKVPKPLLVWYKVTVTPARPVSPESCRPLPLLSTQTKSPIVPGCVSR